MLSVEPGGEKLDECDCCGSRAHTVWGRVCDDERTTAAYYARWIEAHERVVDIAIGLRPSSEDDRISIAAEMWTSDDDVLFSLTDEPLFDRPDELGRRMRRDEALASPLIDEFWHVADHVVAEDPRLIEAARWLEKPEMFNARNPEGLVFTSHQVMRRELPLLLVTHDSDDGAWQFLNGTETDDAANAMLVHPEHVVEVDPSVAELTDLPEGWMAWRESASDSWIREPIPPDWLEEDDDE